MKKTYATVLSSVMLSGAVLVMAPQAWTQTGGSSGAGSSTQKSSEPSGSASSSQRDTSGSSSSDIQTERGQSGAQGQRSAGRVSKDKVKEVQAALKSKGMDPGPEDGVMGPKTQSALREFQKSNSLPVTGRLDNKTASALGVDGSGMGSSRATKDSGGMGSSSSGQSSSSGSTSPQTSEGVSKRGSQAGSPPAGDSKGGTSTAPASKPTGRE